MLENITICMNHKFKNFHTTKNLVSDLERIGIKMSFLSVESRKLESSMCGRGEQRIISRNNLIKTATVEKRFYQPQTAKMSCRLIVKFKIIWIQDVLSSYFSNSSFCAPFHLVKYITIKTRHLFTCHAGAI